MRAKTAVWWPAMTKEIEERVQKCEVCVKEATPRREPLLVTPLPDYPWEIVGTDLFEWKGEQYLIILTTTQGIQR